LHFGFPKDGASALKPVGILYVMFDFCLFMCLVGYCDYVYETDKRHLRVSPHKPCPFFITLSQKCALNRLTPNDPYMDRTAPLTSKCCILYIYSTDTGTAYFKHSLYSPFFSLQNAVCFIMLTCFVPVLLTFYIQDVLKLKK